MVNSSFGGCEKEYASSQGVSELKSLDSLLAAGSAIGLTWVAASGDQAAYNCLKVFLTKSPSGCRRATRMY